MDSTLPTVAPRPLRAALPALARSVLVSAGLLLRGRIHHPRGSVGTRVRFPGGTTSWVYRETVVERSPAAEPCLLVVAFRLRGVRDGGGDWTDVPPAELVLRPGMELQLAGTAEAFERIAALLVASLSDALDAGPLDGEGGAPL